MSSLHPLGRLLNLNTSLPEFNDQISNILHGEEYRQLAKHISGTDALRLVDFLDGVRPIMPHSLLPAHLSRRLWMPLTLPVPVSGDVCENSGTYAARG